MENPKLKIKNFSNGILPESKKPTEESLPSFRSFEKIIRSMGNFPSDSLNYSAIKEQKESIPSWPTDEMIKELFYLTHPTENKYSLSMDESKEIEIDDLISRLFDENYFPKIETTLASITKWAKEDPEKRSNYIEEKIANYSLFRINDKINANMFLALNNIFELNNYYFPSPQLAAALGNSMGMPIKFFDEIAILNRLNSPSSRIILHKILDYLTILQLSMQSAENNGKIKSGGGIHRLKKIIIPFEKKYASNYLIKQHFEDCENSLYVSDSQTKKRTGAIEDVGLGLTNRTILEISSLDESYQLRISSGIYDGKAMDPVLPIAPGYLGLYKDGKILSIFKEETPIKKQTNLKEINRLISENSPENNYIYEEINRKGNDLNFITEIQSFIQKKGPFFFDLRKINLSSLHILTKRELYRLNLEYLQKTYPPDLLSNKNKIEEELFMKKLFPLNDASSEKKYFYLVMSSLFMRKTIKDDFDVDIAKQSFWTQRNFLKFLETREIKDVENLMQFTRKYGEKSLKIFLSLETSFENGEKIIQIAKKFKPEDVDRILNKINEIMDKTEENLTQLIDKNDTTVNPGDVRLKLLEKAHQIILDFSQSDNENIEKLLKDLESSRTEIILLSSLIKSLKKQNIDFDIENIKDLRLEMREIGDESEFSEELKKTVLDMAGKSYSQIYADNPKAFQKVMKKFETRLDNIQNYRVYMLTFQGELVAFCTMQPTETNPKIVMAESLIADPEAQKSSAGMLFAKASLDMEITRQDVEEIQAETRVNNPANEKYEEVLKFDINKSEIKTDPDTGVEYYQMSRKK